MTQPPSVASSNFPYLPVHFIIGTTQAVAFEDDLVPLVDTGFSGGLAVPKDLIPDNIPPDAVSYWTLADNTQTQVNSYWGYVTIGNLSPIFTGIVALENKLLLGRDVTNEFRLIFDHGKQVIVEP